VGTVKRETKNRFHSHSLFCLFLSVFFMCVLSGVSTQKVLAQTNGVGDGGGQGDYRFQWDQPAAAAVRKLLASPQPLVPSWVSKQGLSLTVLVSFTLTRDGLLRDVNIEGSSGYNEVDAAVLEAVRMWRFNASPSSPDIHGLIPYAIRARPRAEMAIPPTGEAANVQGSGEASGAESGGGGSGAATRRLATEAAGRLSFSVGPTCGSCSAQTSCFSAASRSFMGE
jgi:TonB family protein